MFYELPLQVTIASSISGVVGHYWSTQFKNPVIFVFP